MKKSRRSSDPHASEWSEEELNRAAMHGEPGGAHVQQKSRAKKSHDGPGIMLAPEGEDYFEMGDEELNRAAMHGEPGGPAPPQNQNKQESLAMDELPGASEWTEEELARAAGAGE